MADISTPGIVEGRLSDGQYVDNFSDLHPPLGENKAKLEADRCYFCHDAPCMDACPTSIDIPMFIRQISTGNADGAAQTIFSANILGGMCARVCPTETLCEEVCVHVAQGNKAVKIGELQRFATDHAMSSGTISFARASDTGKSVGIVGAGPAGLACAHALSQAGHQVIIYEAREKTGGLNEYGLAAYKTTDDFARREAEFVLSIGAIAVEYGQRLGENLQLETLREKHDAVFIGIGLGNTNDLGIDGQELAGVHDAVDYIADLRQSDDLGSLPVGRDVVVIGGGMTAIDIAIQAKKLGSRSVTIVYRRGASDMGASAYERELAQTNDVTIRYYARPTRLIGDGGKVSGVEFAQTEKSRDGRLRNTGEIFTIQADQVFKAIGQKLDSTGLDDNGLDMERGRIVVDGDGKTSVDGIWAGGDCVAGGPDLTVASVQDGKIAAASINRFLSGKGHNDG